MMSDKLSLKGCLGSINTRNELEPWHKKDMNWSATSTRNVNLDKITLTLWGSVFLIFKYELFSTGCIFFLSLLIWLLYLNCFWTWLGTRGSFYRNSWNSLSFLLGQKTWERHGEWNLGITIINIYLIGDLKGLLLLLLSRFSRFQLCVTP